MKLNARVLLFTFLGGAIGTLLRFAFFVEINSGPRAVMIVNMIGASAIGIFNGHRFFHTDARRAFFSVGFAGGFTTLSGMQLFSSFYWATDYPLIGIAFVAEAIFEIAAGVGLYLLARLFGEIVSRPKTNEAANV